MVVTAWADWTFQITTCPNLSALAREQLPKAWLFSSKSKGWHGARVGPLKHEKQRPKLTKPKLRPVQCVLQGFELFEHRWGPQLQYTIDILNIRVILYKPYAYKFELPQSQALIFDGDKRPVVRINNQPGRIEGRTPKEEGGSGQSFSTGRSLFTMMRRKGRLSFHFPL